MFGGVSNVALKVGSGNLSAPSLPGTKVDFDDATQVSGGFAHDVSDALRVAFVLPALPFQHGISGAGAIKGVGKIVSVKQLAPSVLA